MQELINQVDGVVKTRVGYTGGKGENPSYELISTGLTGHAEAIEITFDPQKISYEKILKFFFTIHDPTTLNRQVHDTGTQYRSEIFYLNFAGIFAFIFVDLRGEFFRSQKYYHNCQS